MISLDELLARKAQFTFRCDTPDCPYGSERFGDFIVVGYRLYCPYCESAVRRIEALLRPSPLGWVAGLVRHAALSLRLWLRKRGTP